MKTKELIAELKRLNHDDDEQEVEIPIGEYTKTAIIYGQVGWLDNYTGTIRITTHLPDNIHTVERKG